MGNPTEPEPREQLFLAFVLVCEALVATILFTLAVVAWF